VNIIHASFSVIDRIRAVSEVSDAVMQRIWPAAELVSPSIDNFIIASVLPMHYCLILSVNYIRSSREASEHGYCDYDTYHLFGQVYYIVVTTREY